MLQLDDSNAIYDVNTERTEFSAINSGASHIIIIGLKLEGLMSLQTEIFAEFSGRWRIARNSSDRLRIDYTMFDLFHRWKYIFSYFIFLFVSIKYKYLNSLDLAILDPFHYNDMWVRCDEMSCCFFESK